MRWLDVLRTRFALLFGGRAVESRMKKEFRLHIDLEVEHLMRNEGLGPEEARRRAMASFGGIERHKEALRDDRGFAWVSALGRDFRYAIRSLLRDRGSVALAVLALSLGIGATTTIVSVMYSVFIAAFPFADSTRVVHFFVHTNGREIGSFPVDEFVEYRARNNVFTNVVGGSRTDVLYEWEGVTYYSETYYLDPEISGLGVRPILGRAPTHADGSEGAPPTFLISDRLWAARFNRDPQIVGRTFKLNGVARTLIGVMPPRFLLSGSDIFLPMTFTATTTAAQLGRSGDRPPELFTFAQLKPGVTKEQAAANIAIVARQIAELFPDRYPSKEFQVTLRTLADVHTSDSTKDMIWVLAGAVFMLLLIACSNVANLLLVRATTRETELALRAGLGASRARLLSQLLAESVVLAAAGAVTGAFLGYAGVQWVRAAIPLSGLPSEMEIRFSTQALLAALGLSVIVTLLSGLAPALRAARGDLQGRLLNSAKGVGARSGRGWVRTTLVAVQMTLAIVLLVGAALMMRTFLAIQNIDPGFNSTNVLAALVRYPYDRPFTPGQRLTFVRQAVDRLRAVPGVESVTPALTMPYLQGATSLVEISGTTATGKWITALDAVGEDYFRTLGVPLVSGRLISRLDVEGARAVAVVNRRFAQEFLGGADPIGRMAHFPAVDRVAGRQDQPVFFEIVGVVGDTRNAGVRTETSPQAYLPYTRVPVASALLLRTTVDPGSLIYTLRREVAAVSPDVALMQPGGARGSMLLEEMVNRAAFSAPKFALGLMAAFAGVGLILSAIGVFSVMTYTVSLQTREIGIRMALGARPARVMRTIVLAGLLPISIGAVLGIAAAYGLSQLIANQIYGVTATDPWTFAGVVVVLAGVGLMACVLPARRAMRVDPLVALRSE